MQGLKAERLFTDLCSSVFMHGFVFHSPKFNDPTEKEAGDIVLWVRRQVVVFEVISRNAAEGSSLKQFVKRIGEKRDQLAQDYNTFKNKDINILLTNEQNEEVHFDKIDLETIAFHGIVIVDCDSKIDNMHFGTIYKSISLPFSVAIMTRQDFLDLLEEVDTIPDLTYYLKDRFEFLKQVYKKYPELFYNLNNQLEKNLISFYKIYNNKFPVDDWDPNNALDYYSMYTEGMRERIQARNIENAKSFIIDKILNFLRQNNSISNNTIFYSWELASLSRRQRSGWLSNKIQDAFERMSNGNPKRHFAFWNEATECWLVFFFQYGGDRDSFQKQLIDLTRYKLFFELRKSSFEYSIFGYGFRKSFIDTGKIFDDIFLDIEDASKYKAVSEEDYAKACEYFGKNRPHEIKEFPI